MNNFEDFFNEIDHCLDVLYSLGAELAEKFGSQPLQSLETDQYFLIILGYHRLQLWSPQAAAMMASPEVGIEPTADPLRVVLAYISTDNAFLDKMTEKAGEMAQELSELVKTAAE
ncbi:hypothetical protein [Pleomorphomonas sp. PLEO]|uniref:hypothetical protein n=1 Tax=Pleomorphomonas sp. PLEO TaxID=3239306 RepID=UPI00351E77F6